MNANFQLLPEAVATGRLESKQDVLEQVAALFARAYAIDSTQALEGIEVREKLGSTEKPLALEIGPRDVRIFRLVAR